MTANTPVSSSDLKISRLAVLAVVILYTLSGAAGLIYEVTWTRMLGLVMGTTIHAAATVLAAFFAGLAFGSVVIGRLTDRMKRPLKVFAAMEVGIALCGLLSPVLFPALTRIYVWLSHSIGPDPRMQVPLYFILAFLVMLVPTTLMGGTYPVILRAVMGGSRREQRRIAGLYAANTTGAVAGAFLTGFVFLLYLGVRQTIFLASAMNLLVAVAAILVSRQNTASVEESGVKPQPPVTELQDESRIDGRILLAVAGVSGFCVLACEVLWTRVLVFFLTHAIFSFATMLTVLLTGLALGSWIVSMLPAQSNRGRLVLLGTLTVAAGAGIVLSTVLFARMPLVMKTLYGDAENLPFAIHLAAKFVVCGMVILVPSIVMGMVLPLCLSLYAGGSGTAVGRRTGAMVAVNTLCGIAGSSLAAFILIPAFGIRPSLAAVAAVTIAAGCAIFIFAVLCSLRARIVALAVAACLLAAMWSVSKDAYPLINLVKDYDIRIPFYEEATTATVSVIEEKDSIRTMLINAIAIHLDYDVKSSDPTADAVKGHLPLLIKPDAERVLVMGFGTGMTLGAIARYPVDELTAIEICPAVIRASEWFSEANGDVLKDPRVKMIVNDARNVLTLATNRYDVITSDVWLSMVTGVTPMTTSECYTQAKEHLSPGGIFGTGAGLLDPYHKVELRTLLDVFDYVYLFFSPDTGAFYAVSSIEPLKLSLRRLDDLLSDPVIREHTARIGIAIPEDLIASFVCGTEGLRRYVGDTPVSTDDLPVGAYDHLTILGADAYRPYAAEIPASEVESLLLNAEPATDLVDDSNPALNERLLLAQQSMLTVMRAMFTSESTAARIAGYQKARSIYPDGTYLQNHFRTLETLPLSNTHDYWTDGPLALARFRIRRVDPVSSGDELSAQPLAPGIVKIAGRDIDEKSTGSVNGRSWALWENGYVAESFSVEADQTRIVDVQARADLSSGEGARLTVALDGEQIGVFLVRSTQRSNYSLPVNLTKGQHTITVMFDNDHFITQERDRNLHIGGVVFGPVD